MRETGTGTNVITHPNMTEHLGQSPRNRAEESTPSSEPFLGVFSVHVDRETSSVQSKQNAVEKALDPHVSQPSTSRRPSSIIHHEGVNPIYDCANADIPEFPVGTSNLEGDMGDLQPVLANAADGIEMEIEHKPEVPLSFNPSLFDQSISSTINWLPTDLFPGAPVDQIKSAGVSLQCNQSLASDPYSSHTACQPPAVTTEQASSLQPQSIFQTPSVRRAGDNMKNLDPYSHARTENSPGAISAESVKRSARGDVDLMGFNPPKHRTKHMPRINPLANSMDPGKQMLLGISENPFNFPIITNLRTDQISKDVVQLAPRIEPSTYDDIYSQFISLCRCEIPFYEIFESERFPTADELTSFIAFFFDGFQAVYPILHLPTFDPNTCHWLLTMSIVAIGCHIADIPEMEKCTTAFHELIRRGLHVEVKQCFHGEFQSTNSLQKERSRTAHCLGVIQAMLFNCIGFLHSRNERDKHSALSSFGELISLANTSCLLVPRGTPFERTSQDLDWTFWIQDEVRRRTGYCIWVSYEPK